MRVSSTQFQATMNRSLQLNQEHLTALTEQMASGQRIQVPSDDPIGYVRLSRLNREESMVTQYRSNISSVKNRMFTDENYLSSMIADMQEGRDLMVWASDGGNTSEDMNSMVNSVLSLRDSLFYTANTKDQEGRYIFSGTKSGTPALSYYLNDPNPPFAPLGVGSRYQYTGDPLSQIVIVGNGITQAVNVNVQDLEILLNQMDTTADTLGQPGVDANAPAVRAVMKAGLDGFDDAISLLSVKIAQSGGAQKILTTLDGNHANVSLSNKMALTKIEQLDYGLAATDLNGYTTALQSTYKAYAKIGAMSLFDVI
jgi:flagellar hook-associated protein 3 FlgL